MKDDNPEINGSMGFPIEGEIQLTRARAKSGLSKTDFDAVLKALQRQGLLELYEDVYGCRQADFTDLGLELMGKTKGKND